MRLYEFTSSKAKQPEVIDPELTKLHYRLRSHYPQFRQNVPAQLEKFVQRSLRHAEETDIRHDAEIAELQKDVADLKKEKQQGNNKNEFK